MRATPLLRRALSAVGVLAVAAASVLVAAPAVAADGAGIVITSPANGTVFAPGSFVSIQGTVSDPGVSYTWSFDGSPPMDLTLYEGGISLGVVTSNGWHTATFWGAGSTASVTFLLDNIGPEVVISSPAEGAVVGYSFLVPYTVGDAVDSWFSLDGGVESRAAPPVSITGLPEGPHIVRVRAVDQYGNSTTVARHFTVDRTGPSVAVTMPADGAWIDPQQPFTIMATSDDPGTQTWDLRVDGDTVAGGPGGTPIGYGMPAPTSWVDGSSHTITAQSTDALGNVGGVSSITVRADAQAPNVTVDALPTTLSRQSIITGAASDSGSGVTQVAVEFRSLTSGDTCGAVEFSGTATLLGGFWSLPLPGAASSGGFCVRATATDGVGRAQTSADRRVDVDVTGPVAPTGLAPSGEYWTAPTAEISWDAVSDAVRYEFRLAGSVAELDTTSPSSTTDTSISVGGWPIGTQAWQVRGIDQFDNVGAWTDPQTVTVLGVPQIGMVCSTFCSIVSDEVGASWSAIPGAIGYRVSVAWPGEDGGTIVEQDVPGDTTSATIALPEELRSGTIVVRVRAVLDHEVEGSTLSPWSERVRYLHVASPATPALLTPAEGSYIDGDGVELRWTDDSNVLAWELRLSPVPTLAEDGGLDTETAAPLLDPMVLLLVVGAGELPEDIDLDQVDAVLDCDALGEYIGIGGEGGTLPFACADGSFTVPEALADGDYYWQVRGYGLSTFLAQAEQAVGPWSRVGHFTVGVAPAVPETGGPTSTGGTPTTGGPKATTPATTVNEITQVDLAGDEPEAVEDAPDAGADPGSSDGGSDDGSAAGGEVTSDAGTGEAFPLGWLLAGVGALIVLAGAGAFIRFRMVRGR